MTREFCIRCKFTTTSPRGWLNHPDRRYLPTKSVPLSTSLLRYRTFMNCVRFSLALCLLAATAQAATDRSPGHPKYAAR